MHGRLVRSVGGAALVVGGLLAGSASAHHSFSAYDMTKTQTVLGTLKEFRWGAPHASMVVMYQGDDGSPSQMSLLCGSPLAFQKQGFDARDFHKGDKIKIVYHPNISGLPGGSLAGLTLTTANGRSYSDGEAAAAAAVPPTAK